MFLLTSSKCLSHFTEGSAKFSEDLETGSYMYTSLFHHLLLFSRLLLICIQLLFLINDYDDQHDGSIFKQPGINFIMVIYIFPLSSTILIRKESAFYLLIFYILIYIIGLVSWITTVCHARPFLSFSWERCWISIQCCVNNFKIIESFPFTANDRCCR